MNTNKAQIKPFTNIETAAFCQQIATIMKSGISLIEGLTIMLEDSETKEERDILQHIIDVFQETGDISTALSDTGLFPKYMVSMTTIGSETGRLDDVMALLAKHYEREAALAKSIKDAFTYPIIMTGMITVVVVILLVKVMPIFNQVFAQLGAELTGFSGALMSAGTFIKSSACGLVIFVCLLLIVGALSLGTDKGRKNLVKIGYRFKRISRLIQDTSACRLAGGMAITLGSGLTVDRSIELVTELNDDERFNEKLITCNRLIAEGNGFAYSLRESGLLTGQYARMASIGEKTGSLEDSMEKIAELYQEDIDSRIGNYMSILEPTLVIILSVVVGAVLLSVMLPLMGIMSTL